MKTKAKTNTEKNELLKFFQKKDISFFNFFHSSPMPTVISTAKDGIIMDINDSMLKLLGYTRKEIIGQSALGLSIWADPASRKSLVNKVKKNGSVSDMALRLKTKNGKIRETAASADHMIIDGVDYLISSFCDITESRQTEKVIRESEEKYRSIVENSHEGILMTDDFENIIFVNDQACAMTGYNRDEILSKSVEDIFGRTFPKSIKRLYNQAIAGKIQEKLTWNFKSKKKEQKYFEIKVSHFQYADKKDRVVIQLLDTTDNHLAKKALKESDERFFNVLDLANDFVWEADEKGLLTFVSSRTSEVTGYNEKELLGKYPLDIMILNDDDNEKVRKEVRTYWDERKPLIHMERKMVHKDGHEIILELSSVPFFDSDGVFRGYRGVSRDITERKNYENMLKKREEELETKTVLLEEANAALKVLLRQRERDKEEIEEKILMNVREMVLPFIEKMKLTRLDVIQEAYMNIIENHLDDIISNFLQRIKSKTLTFTPRETQIAGLIRAGKNTKEITQMLGMSKSAVEFHRNRIRIKLGLNKKKINLRTSLLSIK